MKIKESVRKKLLTTLLIGATLGTTMTSIGASKSFADGNNMEVKYNSVAPKEVSEKIIKGLEESYNNKSRTIQVGCDSKWYGTASDARGKKVVFVEYQGAFYAADQHRNVLTGEVRVGDNVLYFDPNSGRGVKNTWVTLKNEVSGHNGKYHFGNHYLANRNGLENINGKFFLFDKFGADLTGFQNWQGKTYYFDPSTGVRQYGWLNKGGNVYRLPFDDGGAMVKGWYYDLGGAMCFLPESGVMAPGGAIYVSTRDKWHEPGYYCFKPSGCYTYQTYGFWSEGGYRYYFDPSQNGRGLQSQWLSTNTRASNITGSMYFDENGHMAKGVKTINGETYVFVKQNNRDWNYYEGIGWYTDTSTNKRYFFNDGRSARSATEFRNTTPIGAAVKGRQVINGKTYEFDQNGVLKR